MVKVPKISSSHVLSGGFQVGDKIVVDWMSGSWSNGALQGGRLEVFRGEERLKWLTGGFSRDPWGKCVFVPYLKSRDHVKDFLYMVSTLTGHSIGETKDLSVKSFYCRLGQSDSDLSLKVGDHLVFDWRSETFKVLPQGNGDEAGSGGEPEERYHALFRASYVTMDHHPHAIARVLAEAKGLYVRCLGRTEHENSFAIVRR